MLDAQKDRDVDQPFARVVTALQVVQQGEFPARAVIHRHTELEPRDPGNTGDDQSAEAVDAEVAEVEHHQRPGRHMLLGDRAGGVAALAGLDDQPSHRAGEDLPQQLDFQGRAAGPGGAAAARELRGVVVGQGAAQG